MEAWIVWGTWVTAIGTLFLAAVGLWAGINGVKTLKQSKVDSIAQSRPYVYTSVVPGLSGEATFDLVVKNTGQSMARGITMTCFDVPDEPDDIAKALLAQLAQPMDLPPQASIRVFWRLGLPENATWSDGSTEPVGMPKIAHLNVRYTGDIEPGAVYNDSQAVDTRVYELAPVPSSGPEAKGGATPHEKNHHKMLGLIAQSIRELGR